MSALPDVAVVPPRLTLPRRRAAPPALDHQALFAEGLETLRRLSGQLWTDHNVHDPGITTLELLCYALTELSYRATYPVEDLLAFPGPGGPARARRLFPTARRSLHTEPLTAGDYRRLLIDLPGVKNAWLRPAEEVYWADVVEARLSREEPDVPSGKVRVELRGLYDVLIEYMDGVTSAAQREQVRRQVRRTLHRHRNLCEDFVGIDEVREQPFVFCAEIEIDPGASVERVHAEVLFAVQEYLSPPVSQHSLEEMLERTHPDGTPYTVEEIFSGPALRHGFVDDAELEAAELRTEVRLSDVIGAVMDVPGVRAIRDLVLNPRGQTEPLENPWLIEVEDGLKPTLDRARSRLVFYKRGMPFVAVARDVEREFQALADAATARVETPRELDFEVPTGRFREPAAYHSVQNDFPALYGLGEAGLPGGAGERRRALALQLKGYLLLFDQLMADFFAQLSRLRDLFSLDPELRRTYFHQEVDSFVDHERLYLLPDPVRAIDHFVDDADILVERRNRFLDHLIARYAESFADFAGVMRSEFGSSASSLIRYKCEFLADYHEVAARRGSAYDYTRTADADLWDTTTNLSGLEVRLERLLGMRRTARRNLGEVAHEIYDEIDSTPGDEFRFRIRMKNSTKIVLSSSTRYATPADARAAMRRAIEYASLPEGYDRRLTVDGRHYFNIVDERGRVLARRIEYFRAPETMEQAIEELIEYLRTEYSDEGMYVIENVLLRPEREDDPFLPICPDGNCDDCADADPYSYRLHVVLPAYGSRFDDPEFREWAEQVIREETPAHIQPKICWISREQMAELERLYRDWIYLKAGRERSRRAERLRDFIRTLYSLKNVYPKRHLRDCGARGDQEKFVLGRTALGTHG